MLELALAINLFLASATGGRTQGSPSSVRYAPTDKLILSVAASFKNSSLTPNIGSLRALVRRQISRWSSLPW